MKHFVYLIVCMIVFPLSSWGQSSEIELRNLAYITETPYLPKESNGDILLEGRYEFSYHFDDLVLGRTDNVTYAVYNEKRQILRYYENNSMVIFNYDETGKLIEANHYGSEEYDSQNSNLRDSNLFFLLEERAKDLKRLKKIVYNYNSLGQIESFRQIFEDGTSKKQNFRYDSKGRLSGADDMKLVFNATNQLEYKYYTPTPISFKGQEGTFQGGKKYVYREGRIIQELRLYKSTLRMNVKIPERNINESMPLTPELTNAAWSIIRPGISMKVYSVKNPQWESKISEYYEYEKQKDGKQVLQKVYLPDHNEENGRKLDVIYFWEYLCTDSLRQKQKRFLEIERQKRLEEEERKREEIRRKEERKKRAFEERKRIQEEYEKREKEKKIAEELRQLINDNHNKLIKLYSGKSEYMQGFAQLLDLNTSEQKFKKPKLYRAYSSLLEGIEAFDQNTLRDVLVVQKNMELLRKEKTKVIEKRLSEINDKSSLLDFLKNEAMKLKGR